MQVEIKSRPPWRTAPQIEPLPAIDLDLPKHSRPFPLRFEPLPQLRPHLQRRAPTNSGCHSDTTRLFRQSYHYFCSLSLGVSADECPAAILIRNHCIVHGQKGNHDLRSHCLGGFSNHATVHWQYTRHVSSRIRPIAHRSHPRPLSQDTCKQSGLCPAPIPPNDRACSIHAPCRRPRQHSP